MKPVPHDLENPTPIPSFTSALESDELSGEEFFHPEVDEEPHLLTQGDLNDLVRDLSLLKEKAEVLGSRLKQWNLLQKDKTFLCFVNVIPISKLSRSFMAYSLDKLIQHKCASCVFGTVVMMPTTIAKKNGLSETKPYLVDTT